MGIISNLLPGSNSSELNAARDSENRQMSLSKEQGLQHTANTDQTLLQEQEMRTDLIKWQQDLDDELIILIYTLKGYEETADGWNINPENKSALCNDLFINEVIKPQIKPFMSRNIINSNFSEKIILSDLKHTCNDIADAMADGYDKYSIHFTNFDLVMRLIKNTIKAGIYRALNGWTKRLDATSIRRLETHSDGLMDKPKKMFGIFG